MSRCYINCHYYYYIYMERDIHAHNIKTHTPPARSLARSLGSSRCSSSSGSNSSRACQQRHQCSSVSSGSSSWRAGQHQLQRWQRQQQHELWQNSCCSYWQVGGWQQKFKFNLGISWKKMWRYSPLICHNTQDVTGYQTIQPCFIHPQRQRSYHHSPTAKKEIEWQVEDIVVDLNRQIYCI